MTPSDLAAAHGTTWGAINTIAEIRKADAMTLHESLVALNNAAYAAIRAGKDTTLHPYLDRQTLRQIARQTDELVEANAMEAAE